MQTMAENMKIYWAKQGEHDLPAPAQATEGSAGYDLTVCDPLAKRERRSIMLVIPSGAMRIISTGWRVAIPPGHVGLIRDRSGTATNVGLTTRAGVIDADYRGEIRVVVVNEGHNWVYLRHGKRIAQMIIVPIHVGGSIVVESLPDTERGSGGFGSTGGN